MTRFKSGHTAKYHRLEEALLECLNSGGGFDVDKIEDKLWNDAGYKTPKQRQDHLDKFRNDILGTL